MPKQLKIFSVLHGINSYIVHCYFLNIQGEKFLFQWYLFLEAIALANASLEKPETLLVPTLVPNLIFLPRACKICNTELYSYFPTCYFLFVVRRVIYFVFHVIIKQKFDFGLV